jgi:oligoribonuclease
MATRKMLYLGEDVTTDPDMVQFDDAIAWIDLETTGLDPTAHNAEILEVAAVITDADLNVVGTYESVVLNESTVDYYKTTCNDHVVKMHTRTGLFDEIAQRKGANAREVRFDLVDFFSRVEPRTPLGGSTVSFDRNWLNALWPEVLDETTSNIGYHNIDVSSFKYTARRFLPNVAGEVEQNQPPGMTAHRAMDDIMESIRLYRGYVHSWMGW